jgi:hypothetical protein
VLDEPTIGLHPRDTGRLIANPRALIDTGSTVVVDLSPRGGRDGYWYRLIKNRANGRYLDTANAAGRSPRPVAATDVGLHLVDRRASG